MEYLLDTVTVSELRRGSRIHPTVDRWQRTIGNVGLSVITLNEIRYGMRRVEKRDPDFAARLGLWYAQLLAQPERFRILGVDRETAEFAADLRATYETSFPDSLIAATAKLHHLTLATRNTADFAATGIPLVNPWEGEEKDEG